MKAALEHGRALPSFPDQRTAETTLYRLRDERLQKLTDAATHSTTFSADCSPESLKALEAWYFELWDSKSFDAIGIDRKEFECCMGAYLGEVFVRNAPGFNWCVEEFPFEPGKYQLGVRKPLVVIMTPGFADLYASLRNKRRQRVWREYQQYAS